MNRMQTFIAKYKIKDGMRDEIMRWAQLLNERKGQVLESLQEEEVIMELAYLDNQPDGLYLVYVLKTEDIKRAFEKLEESRREVDILHKEILSKALIKPEKLQALIDFENFYHE